MQCLIFFNKRIQMDSFNECDLNKYTISGSKGCILEADLEYTKKLRELHND